MTDRAANVKDNYRKTDVLGLLVGNRRAIENLATQVTQTSLTMVERLKLPEFAVNLKKVFASPIDAATYQQLRDVLTDLAVHSKIDIRELSGAVLNLVTQLQAEHIKRDSNLRELGDEITALYRELSQGAGDHEFSDTNLVTSLVGRIDLIASGGSVEHAPRQSTQTAADPAVTAPTEGFSDSQARQLLATANHIRRNVRLLERTISALKATEALRGNPTQATLVTALRTQTQALETAATRQLEHLTAVLESRESKRVKDNNQDLKGAFDDLVANGSKLNVANLEATPQLALPEPMLDWLTEFLRYWCSANTNLVHEVHIRNGSERLSIELRTPLSERSIEHLPRYASELGAHMQDASLPDSVLWRCVPAVCALLHGKSTDVHRPLLQTARRIGVTIEIRRASAELLDVHIQIPCSQASMQLLNFERGSDLYAVPKSDVVATVPLDAVTNDAVGTDVCYRGSSYAMRPFAPDRTTMGVILVAQHGERLAIPISQEPVVTTELCENFNANGLSVFGALRRRTGGLVVILDGGRSSLGTFPSRPRGQRSRHPCRVQRLKSETASSPPFEFERSLFNVETTITCGLRESVRAFQERRPHVVFTSLREADTAWFRQFAELCQVGSVPLVIASTTTIEPIPHTELFASVTVASTALELQRALQASVSAETEPSRPASTH